MLHKIRVRPAARKRLEAVTEYMAAHPEETNMDDWICGAVACVAGRTVLMFGMDETDFIDEDEDGVHVWSEGGDYMGEVAGIAANLLDLPIDTLGWGGDYYHPLFRVSDWQSGDHKTRYFATDNPNEQAAIVVEYLRWFMQERLEVTDE